jgi:hypothetical protein
VLAALAAGGTAKTCQMVSSKHSQQQQRQQLSSLPHGPLLCQAVRVCLWRLRLDSRHLIFLKLGAQSMHNCLYMSLK